MDKPHVVPDSFPSFSRALNTGDFEHDFRAWIVAGVAAILAIVGTLLTIQDLILGQYLVAGAIFLCPLSMAYAFWRLIYGHDLQVAANIVVIAALLAGTLVLVLSGGHATGPYVFFPIVVLLATIVTTPRFALAIAIACVLLPLTGAWLTSTALEFPVVFNEDRMLWGAIRMSIVTALVCFGCMHLYSKSSDRTRGRLIESQIATQEANSKLKETLKAQAATLQLLSKLQEVGKLKGWWYEPEMDLVHHTFSTTQNGHEFTIGSMVLSDSTNTDLQPALREMIIELMAHGQNWDKELLIPDETGSEIWYHTTGEIERSGEKVQRVVGVIHDISDIKDVQAKNTQSQKMEAIGTLAAGIAHEINTPVQYVTDNLSFISESFGELQIGMQKITERLQSGKGEANLALKRDIQKALDGADIEYLFDELPRALSESVDGLNAIKTIVQAMKVFAHPGDQKKMMVDLNEVVRSTLIVCANRWKCVADAITFYDPNLPRTLCMPDEISQVVVNIIVNAADSIQDLIDKGITERGAITISTLVDSGFIEICISDTGCGISEKIRERIFDPFFTTKEVGKGTGQGLAISYDIVVNRHEGALYCDSESGKGTSFRIRLPVSEKGRVEGDDRGNAQQVVAA